MADASRMRASALALSIGESDVSLTLVSLALLLHVAEQLGGHAVLVRPQVLVRLRFVIFVVLLHTLAVRPHVPRKLNPLPRQEHINNFLTSFQK